MNNDIQLISVDDLKEITSISNNIQTELLEPYLEIGQGFFVDDLIGEALLTELKNQVTGNTLTNLNQTLLSNYIKPVVAYGAWHEYVGMNSSKTTQKGEVLQSSEHSQNADLNQLTFKRQALKDKINFYQERLKTYLEKNKQSYPLYRSSCTTNNNNYANGIYLGRFN